MKKKISENIKSLFKSSIDNRILFERRKNSFLVPLIIFIITISMMILPTYISSSKMKSDDVMKNFPKIHEPMEWLLTSSLDCSVNDQKLICDEGAQQINVVVGDDIKYSIIANQKTISANLEVDYSSPKDTDNFIMLLNNYIRIRYIERDHVNQKIITYEIIGDYSKFEGLKFKEISSRIESNPDILDSEIKDFILTTYNSTLDTKLIVNLSSSLLSFTLFVIVSSIILKWPTLFRRKKGFKFGECLKLSLTSSLPALISSIALFLLLGINFSLVYSVIYIVRLLFIYFKYILSTKNSIFKELYTETREERFNL